MSFETNIKKLGIIIPKFSKNLKTFYEQSVLINDLIYISGQLPIVNKKLKYKGIVGVNISIKEAYEASKICIINAISVIKNHILSIEKIEKIVQINGFVNCNNDFIDHPRVIDGASDLLLKIFGNTGKHSRFAIGVSSLPLGSPVEISMIIKIKNK